MEPRRDRPEGGPPVAEQEPVLEAAERCLRTWEPVWTGFLDGALREEAEARLGALSDLRLEPWGGHAGAERCRLLLQRSEAALPLDQVAGDFVGLEIAGNFLFDPAEPADFRAALLAAGALPEELGDLWVRGDRGAQAITAQALAARLQGQAGRVRTVEVHFEARPLAELQLPPRRQLPDPGHLRVPLEQMTAAVAFPARCPAYEPAIDPIGPNSAPAIPPRVAPAIGNP
jgi:RNA-binding protein YlmH